MIYWRTDIWMTSSLKLFPVYFNSLLYKTNRFQVAVHLFSNRSQRTSKCGKNISDTLGCALCATFLFLPHFHVICDLLLNRRTTTWNLFVNLLIPKNWVPWITLQVTFNSQDLISSSPYCLPYSSCDVSLEKLVLDQLINKIP